MALTIVTSHWNEDLEWLKSSKFPVVLIDKEGAPASWLASQHVVPNKGHETTAYFKYIIENYENLPDHVAFIHGHEHSWHQMHSRPLLEVIESANIQKYEYIPLNNFFRYYGFQDEITGVPETPVFKFKTFWNLLGFPYVPDGAPFLVAPSSQYIVSKRLIQKVPKKTWEAWYHTILMSEPADARIWPVFFDYIQHIIFGEGMILDVKNDWFAFEYTPKYWHQLPEFCNPTPSSS